MLNDGIYREIIRRIEPHMESDMYSREGGFYGICNIYYDTADDRLIRRSIEKPVYKEKLRLRAYGTPDGGSEAFVEIKKKYREIVNKRRIVLTLDQARAYLDEDIRPKGEGINAQILRELDYFKDFYGLMPKVYIAYDRRAYFDREDGDFRVTFDTNIRARRTRLRFEEGGGGDPLLEEGQWLMEIKFSDAVPPWFCKILTELKLYPVSFSKYGAEYAGYVENTIKKGEKFKCSSRSSTQPIPPYQPARQLL